MSNYEQEPKEWITIKGNKIPIFEGQTKESVVKDFIEQKKFDSKNIITAEKSKTYNFQTGKPVVVEGFHGGNAGIKKFDAKGRDISTMSHGVGNYFSNNKSIADTYVKQKNGALYKVILKMDNPLVVDYKGKYFNDIIEFDGLKFGKITGYSDTSIPSSTEIVEYAQKKGYDGVILKNIKDYASGKKLIGKADKSGVAELLKLSDEELFNRAKNYLYGAKIKDNPKYNAEYMFNDHSYLRRKGMRQQTFKNIVREHVAEIISDKEHYKKHENELIGTDYVVFDNKNIKIQKEEVNNSINYVLQSKRLELGNKY